MRLWLWAALGLGALLVLPARAKSFQPITYPTIRNKTFIKECLDAHNEYRAGVTPEASTMRYMTWDLALARIARAWANKCIFEHNEQTKVHPDSNLRPAGENLWISNARSRGDFNTRSAISAWHNEVKYYNYKDGSCTRVCGHYTQVVWDTSYKLGCAIVFCRTFEKKTNIENFVCNYGPGGNSPRKPYLTGKPCSRCQKGDTCENNLCRNSDRDRDVSKRYSRWYPPFEFRIICDESCIAVAVLRPLLMLLAFGVVLYLKSQHPNLNSPN